MYFVFLVFPRQMVKLQPLRVLAHSFGRSSIISVLESSLSQHCRSIVQSGLYAINWVHKLAGFEDVNTSFLLNRLRRLQVVIPVGLSRGEAQYSEITGLIFNHYGGNTLKCDVFTGQCKFFHISEPLCIRRSNIVTEDRYRKNNTTFIYPRQCL